MRFKTDILGSLLLALLLPATLLAVEIIKVEDSELGFTIMGEIVQKNSDNSVALIKEASGSVKAVKKDSVIGEKFKVVAVFAGYIEAIARDAKRYYIYQAKFDMALAAKSTVAAPIGPLDQFREDGFERINGKVTMTGSYRDKLIREDLAKVMMQATAEPFYENGSIIGFKMSQVDEGSIFSKSGLRNGDIISNINGTEMNNIAGAIVLLKSLKTADHIDLELRRDGVQKKFSIDVR